MQEKKDLSSVHEYQKNVNKKQHYITHIFQMSS